MTDRLIVNYWQTGYSVTGQASMGTLRSTVGAIQRACSGAGLYLVITYCTLLKGDLKEDPGLHREAQSVQLVWSA